MTAEPLPRAFVSHRAPGRIRIRIPGSRGDATYFARLERGLAGIEGVTRLEANPRTGSVLVCHRGEVMDALEARGRETGLFELGPEPVIDEAQLLAIPGQLLEAVDARLFRASRGAADIRSLLFLALLLAGIRQIAKGRVMAPGISLVWYALELLLDRRR